MSTTETVVVVVAVVVTLAVVAWFVFTRKFPERAASHGEPRVGANVHRSVTRDVAERPAGPDAESMDASRPGGATPPPPPPQDEQPRP